MKWPKRRRNQATHVFTHALNKQENKGTGVVNSARAPESGWDATRGSHHAAPIGGPRSQEGRWEEGERLGGQDALSKLSLDPPLGLHAGRESQR